MRPFVFLIILYLNTCCIAQTLKINISGIRNTSGTIRVCFYTTSKSFDDEKPSIIKIESKAKMTGGDLSINYTDLKPGTYGIAILDDENSNQKMDYGWVLPKEGFGFSDYYHTTMSRPKFESFDFVLKKEDKTVSIKVRYL